MIEWIDLPDTKSRVAASPVTNRMWQKFLQESGYTPNEDERDGDYLKHWVDGKPPEDQLDKPVVYVSSINAWAFCDFCGYRLPTEAEVGALEDHGVWEWFGDHPSVSCRGGSFYLFARGTRCAYRGLYSPQGCIVNVGFRPAQDIVQ